MSIESRRLAGMGAVAAALLSAFEVASLDEWRASTLTALRALFDAPKGFLYTPQVNAIDVHIETQGVEAAQMHEYARDWLAEDFDDARALHQLRMPVACRETMWYETGWTLEQVENYARSPIWNDYHKRWGMLEGAGYFATREPPPGGMYLYSGFYMTGEKATNPMFFGEGMEIASAIAPIFDAGIKLALLRAQLSGSIPRWIDELPGVLAIFDTRGRVVHRNRNWVEAIQSSAIAVETVGSSMAKAVIHELGHGTGIPVAARKVAVGDVLLTATHLRLPDYPDSFVLLIAELKSPPRVDYFAHALQLGLPPRLAEVAALIAIGRSNADIAAALSIRASTARRQTERVLRRLGVARRAGVAARLVSHG